MLGLVGCVVKSLLGDLLNGIEAERRLCISLSPQRTACPAKLGLGMLPWVTTCFERESKTA
jgi:hypothetical protein